MKSFRTKKTRGDIVCFSCYNQTSVISVPHRLPLCAHNVMLYNSSLNYEYEYPGIGSCSDYIINFDNKFV